MGSYQLMAMLAAIAGIVILCLYSIWEQRRQLAKLTDKVSDRLKGAGWSIDPHGRDIRRERYSSSLPLEMITSKTQMPYLWNHERKAWVFGNVKTMHRRLHVFGNRVVVVISFPYRLQSGVRLQENIRYANTKRPFDPRFCHVEELQKYGRNWWLCATDESSELAWLRTMLNEHAIPDEIQVAQIVDQYLVCSSRLRIDKEDNYHTAIKSSFEVYSQLEKTFVNRL